MSLSFFQSWEWGAGLDNVSGHLSLTAWCSIDLGWINISYCSGKMDETVNHVTGGSVGQRKWTGSVGIPPAIVFNAELWMM